MPRYQCRIINDRGEAESISLTAENPASLQSLVEHDGRFLVSWQEEADRQSGRRIRRRDLYLFSRELQILLHSGMTIPDSLDIAGEHMVHPRLQRILKAMSLRIREGVSLSEAFAAHEDIFGRFYVQSVRAGEEAGTLPAVLGRLAEHEKRSYRLRDRITQALAYPAVLVGVSFGVLAFLVFFVLPSFQVVFRDLQVAPPVSTQWLFSVTAWLKVWGLPVLFALFVALALGSRLPGIRRRLVNLPIRLPFVGQILHKYETSRFAGTFSLLIAGGMPAMEAMRSATSVLARVELQQRLYQAADRLEQGQSLAESLRESEALDAMAVRLVHVGERSGSLSVMLDAIAALYEEEIDHEIDVTASLVEPLLLLFMGLVIGTIILMVFLPVVRMSMVV